MFPLHFCLLKNVECTHSLLYKGHFRASTAHCIHIQFQCRPWNPIQRTVSGCTGSGKDWIVRDTSRRVGWSQKTCISQQSHIFKECIVPMVHKPPQRPWSQLSLQLWRNRAKVKAFRLAEVRVVIDVWRPVSVTYKIPHLYCSDDLEVDSMLEGCA